jgi:hypothetical protein
MNINLHIERLVLDGVDVSHAERSMVQEATEAELARLLALGGLAPGLSAGGALHHVRGGTIQLQEGQNGTALGKEVAQAIHRGIGQ